MTDKRDDEAKLPPPGSGEAIRCAQAMVRPYTRGGMRPSDEVIAERRAEAAAEEAT